MGAVIAGQVAMLKNASPGGRLPVVSAATQRWLVCRWTGELAGFLVFALAALFGAAAAFLFELLMESLKAEW